MATMRSSPATGVTEAVMSTTVPSTLSASAWPADIARRRAPVTSARSTGERPMVKTRPSERSAIAATAAVAGATACAMGPPGPGAVA